MLPKQDKLNWKEESLRKEIAELDQEQKTAFYRELEKETRDPDTYAVLAYLAFAGFQHFYLGKWIKGISLCSLFLIAVALCFYDKWLWGGNLLTLIVFIEMYYLFDSQRIVKNHNNNITAKVLARFQTPSSRTPKEKV